MPAWATRPPALCRTRSPLWRTYSPDLCAGLVSERAGRTPDAYRRLRALPVIKGDSQVGLPGLEPGTSSLSEKRSNRLSYRPFGWRVYRTRRRDNLHHHPAPDNPIEQRRGGGDKTAEDREQTTPRGSGC